MTLQQIKYAVSALAIIQMVIALVAIILIVKHVVVGIRKGDKSKYRRATVTLIRALGLLLTLAIVQFLILMEW